MALYTSSVYQNVVAADLNELAWLWARNTIAYLKTVGWTTRGSSIDGTSGNAWSATPDTTDRWAGLSLLQARGAGGNTAIWHVIQNTATGLQACILLSTASAVTMVVSVNKLDNGGVWRGGGTSAAARPADTTSTPAVGRESATGAITPNTPVGSTTYRFNYLARYDGKGFYSYYFPDSGAVSNTLCSVMGMFPTNQVKVGETNPYISMVMTQVAMALTGGGNTSVWSSTPSSHTNWMTGRSGSAGNAYRYRPLSVMASTATAAASDIIGNTFSNDPDPDTAKLPMFSTGIWTDGSAPPGSADAHFRGAVPDVFMVSSLSPVVQFVTFNTMKYIVLGNFAFPYGGLVTPRSTDQTGYILRHTASAAPPPAPPQTTDIKAVNRGFELI